MITCQDILELQLDGVELIAGEKGLTRPVTWTYMVQTRPFEEHMNQGNFALCVVDYVRFDLEEAGKATAENRSELHNKWFRFETYRKVVCTDNFWVI